MSQILEPLEQKACPKFSQILKESRLKQCYGNYRSLTTNSFCALGVLFKSLGGYDSDGFRTEKWNDVKDTIEKELGDRVWSEVVSMNDADCKTHYEIGCYLESLGL